MNASSNRVAGAPIRDADGRSLRCSRCDLPITTQTGMFCPVDGEPRHLSCPHAIPNCMCGVCGGELVIDDTSGVVYCVANPDHPRRSGRRDATPNSAAVTVAALRNLVRALPTVEPDKGGPLYVRQTTVLELLDRIGS